VKREITIILFLLAFPVFAGEEPVDEEWMTNILNTPAREADEIVNAPAVSGTIRKVDMTVEKDGRTTLIQVITVTK
jgi:hypothetical protein